jgi:DNA-binding MarR family transcriptional regulator
MLEVNVEEDIIDRITRDLVEIGVEVDTSGLAVTGRILRLARNVESARDRLLRAFGLSVADFDVMATLRRRAAPTGLKTKHLQTAVMITSGGMTKRLDRLESAGLIERHPDPQDRRGVLITLTTEGRLLIDKALPVLLREEAKMIGDAIGNARDRERLAGLLRHLLVAMDGRT